MSATVSAQTSIVPGSQQKIAWDQAAPDLATAQGYSYTVSDSGVALAVESPVCTNSPTAGVFICKTPVPALTPGAHSLVVKTSTMIDGTLIESPPSVPLAVVMVAVPATPQNLRLER